MLLRSRHQIMFGLCLLLVGLTGVSPVAAQGPETAPWTTAGSAGTVDETDLLNVALGSPVAGAVTVLSTGTVHIRYNVVAVAGVLGGRGFTLTARYQTRPAPIVSTSLFFAPTPPAQVLIRLMQYNLNTGALTNLLTLDSNNFPQADGFQVQSVATAACFPPFLTLDFVNNSYFMDVSLTKPAGSPVETIFAPRPALAMIKLANNAPCIF